CGHTIAHVHNGSYRGYARPSRPWWSGPEPASVVGIFHERPGVLRDRRAILRHRCVRESDGPGPSRDVLRVLGPSRCDPHRGSSLSASPGPAVAKSWSAEKVQL